MLANIGEEPIAKLSGVKTLADQAGINNVELWNGLFVKKGTPQATKDKIAEIAKASMTSDRAKELMAESGARIYWQDADASAARITADNAKFDELNAMLN
ncbi:MAG: hypothetical protein ACJZ8A_03035 [Paracoccaceae bacterium]